MPARALAQHHARPADLTSGSASRKMRGMILTARKWEQVLKTLRHGTTYSRSEAQTIKAVGSL